MATRSCSAGTLTPVMPSVTGCSTWSRGFSSRKLYSPVLALKRYSTVPAPRYPTDFARRIAACSIFRKVSSGAIIGGPSSKIFWKRLCVEQSRPFKATTSPCSSPTNCTSKCRAPVHRAIMKIGEPTTSIFTWSYALLNSASVVHFRMPFPPPPSEALSITGYPIRLAHAMASSRLCKQADLNTSSGNVPSGRSSQAIPSPFHGIHGTPAACARIVEAILSPSACITGAVGPMKVMPISLSVLGRAGFSLACPHPGQTASTFCFFAISQIRGTFA
mmetsp:Transcript_14116/g.35627  ORF Transcript_14116/g.35627 Transcript_14116/m.35627 type:complete len:275 (-) Transcript_14116:324-1148(-)